MRARAMLTTALALAFAAPAGTVSVMAWNGSRVTFAHWCNLSGQDASSIDSPPPTFAPSGRVASGNMGTSLDPKIQPDIGAYQRVKAAS